MVNLTSFLLAVLAHILSDFLFQTEKMVQAKNRKQWAGFFQHALIVILMSVLLLHAYETLKVFIFALIIGTIHFWIDFLRYSWTAKSSKSDFFGFIFDQILHFGVIFGTWLLIDLKPELAVERFYASLYSMKTMTAIQQKIPNLTINVDQLLVILIITFFICWGGAIFIKKFLRLLMKEDENILQSFPVDHYKNTGYYIGIIERLIILILVVNNALAGTAFIFTAKSIARFNELNDKQFAEYYLVGTLTSTALAMCGGLFLKYLLEVV